MLNYIHYIGYILLVLGALFLILGLRHLSTARASRTWESTNGKVIKSSVKRSQDGADDNSPKFYPQVEYEYFVAAKRYEGSEIYAGSSSDQYSTEMGAAQVSAGHPVDSPVTVYYDPQHPERSVLKPGEGKQGGKEVRNGILFLLAGAAAVLYHFFIAVK
jgi:hypothetical protein